MVYKERARGGIRTRNCLESFGFKDRCVYQFRHTGIAVQNGGAEGIRTPGPTGG